MRARACSQIEQLFWGLFWPAKSPFGGAPPAARRCRRPHARLHRMRRRAPDVAPVPTTVWQAVVVHGTRLCRTNPLTLARQRVPSTLRSSRFSGATPQPGTSNRLPCQDARGTRAFGWRVLAPGAVGARAQACSQIEQLLWGVVFARKGTFRRCQPTARRCRRTRARLTSV